MFMRLGKATKIRNRRPYKRTPVRCTKCKARFTFSMHPEDYIRPRRCGCGNRKFFVDKWMLRRGREQKCGCGGYWFYHRKGGGWCEHNPNLEAYAETHAHPMDSGPPACVREAA